MSSLQFRRKNVHKKLTNAYYISSCIQLFNFHKNKSLDETTEILLKSHFKLSKFLRISTFRQVAAFYNTNKQTFSRLLSRRCNLDTWLWNVDAHNATGPQNKYLTRRAHRAHIARFTICMTEEKDVSRSR